MTFGSDSRPVEHAMSSTQRLVVRDQELGGFRTIEVPADEIFVRRGPGGALTFSSDADPSAGPVIGLRSSDTGIVLTRSSEGVTLNGRPVEAGQPLGRFGLLEFAGALLRSESGLSTSEVSLESINDTRPDTDSGSAPDLRATLPEVGVVFAGRYGLQEVLGQGGFGAVYKAWDNQLQRPVAIKVLVRAEGRALQRFAMEIRAMASLRHPNLVTIFDSGIEGEHPFLVMELIEGLTLDKVVANGVSPTRAAAILRDVTRAVSYAHQQGMLHRDIKPMNIIVQPDGTPRLVDFGLVRLFDAEGFGQTQTRITREGTRLGTLPYMSPEQAFAGEQDERSEVYGLGATLYHTLVGEHPFSGAEELLLAIVNTPAVPPRERDPRIPEDLEAICLKCLEKRPRDRYPTAASLGADLERFLDGEATLARPLSFWGQVGRKLTQGGQQSVLILAAAAVLVVGMLSAALIYQARAARDRELQDERDAQAELDAQRAAQALRDAQAKQAALELAERLEDLRLRLDRLGRGQPEDEDAWRLEALQVGDAIIPELATWLGGLSEELLGIEDRVYLEANVLRADEREKIAGLAEAVDASHKRRLGDPTPSAEALRLQAARERLVDRARAGGEGELSFRDLVAQAQLDRLGVDRFRASALALRVLEELVQVDAEQPQLVEPLVRHLQAESDDRRAVIVGRVLLGLEGDVFNPLMAAAVRFGVESEFAKVLGPRLAQLASRVPGGDTVAGQFERARFHRILGDTRGALRELDAVIERDGFHARAVRLRAKIRSETGDLDGAREDLNKAVELLPRAVDLLIERGKLCMRQGDAEAAREDARAALKLDRGSAEAMTLEGRALLYQGDRDAALVSFSEAIARDAGCADAWAARGALRAMLGRYTDAAADGSKATQLDPRCARGWAVLGQVSYRRGEHQKAVTQLSRAIDYDAEEASFRVLRAQAYAELGKAELAEADMDEAKLRTPEDQLPRLFVMRSRIRTRLGNLRGARTDLDWAVGQDPELIEARRERLSFLARAGEYEAAIADCLKVLEEEPRNPAHWAMLAQLYYATGAEEKAKLALETAFKRDPNSPDAHFARGLHRFQKKDYRAALADFDRVFDLQPGNSACWFYRGQALILVGRMPEAKVMFERYVLQAPRGAYRKQADRLLEGLRAKGH